MILVNKQNLKQIIEIFNILNYRQTMSVLKKAKEFNPQLITKSSIMLGLGETDEQIKQTLRGTISLVVL